MYQNGPFVGHYRTLTLPTLRLWLAEHNRTLNCWSEQNTRTIDIRTLKLHYLLIFDHPNDASHCEVLDQESFEDIWEWKEWIQRRYNSPVKLKLLTEGGEKQVKYELKWAHSRGNTRLYSLNNDRPLIISDGDEVVQYTKPGHLFVLMNVADGILQENSCTNDEDQSQVCSVRSKFDNAIGFHRIVGLFIVPAYHLTSPDEYITITMTPYYNSSTLDIQLVTYYQHYHDVQSISDESFPFLSNHRHCLYSNSCNQLLLLNSPYQYYRTFLLTYWEFQRKCQIWMSYNLLPWENDFSPPRELYTIIQLPSLFMKDLKEKYLRQRNTTSLMSTSYSEESYISMVFNQYESPTFYAPLDPTDLRYLERLIKNEVSKWLSVPLDELEFTGSYGIREYRKDAVIRWHVDPVETQPITAIIHIADSCSMTDRSNCAEESNWSIEVPRYDIEDLEYYNIVLKEGEALLLRSAKLPHARLKPLQLDYYANAFVHLRPRGWLEKQEVIGLSS
eukprot:gene10306-11208_t